MIVTFKRTFRFPSLFDHYKYTMVPNIYTIITIVYIQWLPLYTCRHQSCKGETRSSTVLKLCSRYYLHGNIVHWIKKSQLKTKKAPLETTCTTFKYKTHCEGWVIELNYIFTWSERMPIPSSRLSSCKSRIENCSTKII